MPHMYEQSLHDGIPWLTRAYASRTLVLNISMFDFKQRFIDALYSSSGGGMLCLETKSCHQVFGFLHQIWRLLHDDQLQEQPQVFKEANFIGFQEGDYWLLSPKVEMNS